MPVGRGGLFQIVDPISIHESRHNGRRIKAVCTPCSASAAMSIASWSSFFYAGQQQPYHGNNHYPYHRWSAPASHYCNRSPSFPLQLFCVDSQWIDIPLLRSVTCRAAIRISRIFILSFSTSGQYSFDILPSGRSLELRRRFA